MKCIVLSSGGVDSTTCVAMAVDKYGKENVSTVSIYYGQTLSKEIEGARKISDHYGLDHYEFDLSSLFQYSKCTLIKSSGNEICHKSYEAQIENGEHIGSYVPFRNGLMLSTVATLAQSIYPNDKCVILLGNHASDYAYPDCSIAFVESMNKAISEGTYGLVHIESPLLYMTKTEVVAEGLRLGVPYEYTWSCYEGKEKACGKCGSCIDRRQAFRNNGVEDPIEYED